MTSLCIVASLFVYKQTVLISVDITLPLTSLPRLFWPPLGKLHLFSNVSLFSRRAEKPVVPQYHNSFLGKNKKNCQK